MATGEIHEGPLVPAVATAAPAKPTWREQRRRRRRRRRIGEEILGWLLVPVILFAGYWTVNAVFSAMGTTPGAVYEQAKLAKQVLEKKGGL
jgi:hypothetical protein